MRIARCILILLVGGSLAYLTYLSQYQTFFFDLFIWGAPILLGSLVFIWTVDEDIHLYKKEKKVKSFMLTFLCLLFVAAISISQIIINAKFNKPTLLRVYYDGDFNGDGIDFKTDGTYIFNKSAIGISDYSYGTYTIDSNMITITGDTTIFSPALKYLEIKESKYTREASAKKELYLVGIDKTGQDLQEYRVIIDNRK